MTHPDDILAMLKQVKYDLSVEQTRIDEAIRAVAALPCEPKEPHECPECKRVFPSVPQLEEHRYLHHDGPITTRDRRALELAGLSEDPT